MMRVGVVGVGRLGSLFATVLAGHPDVDSLSLAGSKPDSANALAERLGAEAMPTAVQVIDSVDAVVIAASTSAHADLIARAAKARIPMFCEKPISLDLDSTDVAIEHAKAAGVELQIGFQRRFEPGYRAARDLVRSGALGDIYAVHTASLDPAPSPEAFVTTSGDLFRDLVIHDFDAVRFVMGQEIEEVFATGTSEFPAFAVYERHDDAGVGVGVLRLSGGTVGTFTATRHNPAGLDVRMEIAGSRDSVVVGSDDRMPLRSVEPGVEPPPGVPYHDFLDRFASGYRAEMQAFVDLVAGRGPNLCPSEEGRAAFVAALAAHRSVAEGRSVHLAEFERAGGGVL
jgi:myo-inositol 2-dehydrogenase/D-chiro-inositol 1-dehydrogenase